MPQHFIVSFIGNDRTGLVEQVAECIRRHEGNWLQSQLSYLEGKFAGLILIDLPPEHAQNLETDLTQLPSGKASVRVTPVSGAETTTSASHRLDVLGPDRAGIIKEVSHALSEANINIVAMETRVENAPFTGEPMFKAQLEVNVPVNVDVGILHARLEEIAEAMTLEIDLH